MRTPLLTTLFSLLFISPLFAAPLSNSTTTGSVPITSGNINPFGSGSGNRIIYDPNVYNGAESVPFCTQYQCRAGVFFVRVTGRTPTIYRNNAPGRLPLGYTIKLKPSGLFVSRGGWGSACNEADRGVVQHPSYPLSVNFEHTSGGAPMEVCVSSVAWRK